MDWNAGYVTDLEYTHGYYRELCPDLLRLACLSAGIAAPSAKPLHYLELGFGQGLSLNIHAAANPGIFWGTDFNPSQAAHASCLAEASGAGATLLDASFAELAARPDLPEFDVIALHGIWTWISRENRQVIVDLIRRKLRVGGLVYLSYNCFPGWAPAEPLRHLMNLHADLAGSSATGTTAKVEGALKFAQEVADSGAMYFRANPAVGERLKKIAGQSRNYLAHEFFNRDWDLMAFSDVADSLGEAKLSFAASAHLLDHLDGINLSVEGQKLLHDIQHPVLKQSVRDYFVNQQFRRDIFVKGPRRLTPLERHEALLNESFVLMVAAQDVPLKVTGSLGEASLQEKIYRPVLEALADKAYAPKKLSAIQAHPQLKDLPGAHVLEAILALVGGGHVNTARISSNASRAQSRALNQHLCMLARSSGDISFLASPVTGSGILVTRFQQLFLLAMQQGKKTVAEQVSFAWGVLSGQGQRLLKDGKPLEPDDNIAELTKQAEEFASKRLPILRAIEVV